MAGTFFRLVLPNLIGFFLCRAGSTNHQQWHQTKDGSNIITAITTAWRKKPGLTFSCSLTNRVSLPIIILVTISNVFPITQTTITMPVNGLSHSDATHASLCIGVAGVAICVAQLSYAFVIKILSSCGYEAIREWSFCHIFCTRNYTESLLTVLVLCTSFTTAKMEEIQALKNEMADLKAEIREMRWEIREEMTTQMKRQADEVLSMVMKQIMAVNDSR